MFNRPTLPNYNENPNGSAVLFSGGIDSTVVLAKLIKEHGRDSVFPIAFDDGTLNFHLRRSVALELSTQSLGVYNRLIVAKIPELEVLRKSVSGLGFIPGMKMLMLVTTLSYCHVLQVSKIYTGYNDDNQKGGFIDENNIFMDNVARLFHEGYGQEENTDYPFKERISIENPFYNKSKAHVIQVGHDLGVDLSTTISCRQLKVGAGLIHCGTCKACHRRAIAFKEAGVPDPTIYQTRPNI